MAGRVQFNDRCSHCHGTDGFSPVRERDVRYLKIRYGDKWQETAMTTIKNGRPDNGMPTWGGRIPEYQIWQIVAYVRSMNSLEPASATPARSDEIEPQPTLQNRVKGETK